MPKKKSIAPPLITQICSAIPETKNRAFLGSSQLYPVPLLPNTSLMFAVAFFRDSSPTRLFFARFVLLFLFLFQQEENRIKLIDGKATIIIDRRNHP